ncbi:tyrosine--tRNA ligase [Proteinivorax hydrogeniformans]|uniref:Tyrosine--tRNA ligase n=1 Tax=Proteinivorax hydrogeniformans TaxID=1826727 RepID=A0AAU8HST5_9FIRM
MKLEKKMEILRRGTDEIISEKLLEERLELDRPLIVKYGADPTAADLHIGHMVPMRKLRDLQKLGHKIVFVIGDFTAAIGDPSGKSETRKMLTREQILENAKTYQEQVFKVLDKSKTEVVYNSSWLGEMRFDDVIRLSSKYTVARMIERDDFEKRYKSGTPISIHEFLYPLAQAQDSVHLESDIEVGGSDQKFNFLVARDLQREAGQNPQVVITLPILEGLDGKQKMSKSLNNYIGITDEPKDMYGKVMSIPDSLIVKYYELCTDVPLKEINDIKNRLEEGNTNPRDFKMRLGREIVSIYHGQEQADMAEQEFQKVFQKRRIPTDIEEIEIDVSADEEGTIWLPKVLADAGLVQSTSEGRRMVKQSAVKINQEQYNDEKMKKPNDKVLVQVGKRRFKYIVFK